MPFANADLFDVWWQAVALMLAVIALPMVLVCVRTNISIFQTGGWRTLLGFGVLVALYFGRDVLRRR